MSSDQKILINGCYRTKIAVFPKNWKSKSASLKKDWYIWYRFHDPAYRDRFPNGKLEKIRGMNKFKNLQLRQANTQDLLDNELHLIDVLHRNPITNQFMTEAPEQLEEKQEIPADDRTLTTPKYLELLTDLVPEKTTPFIPALWLGLKRCSCVEGAIIDMGSIIRGTETAAQKLGIDKLKIEEVRRRHLVLIFEECRRSNPSFSNARHNKYRAYLLMIFKKLVALEVIDSNPLKDIERLKETKKEREVLTEEERKLINDHLFEKDYNFWRFIQIFFHSGARETELMKVTESDVDLRRQRFRILVRKGVENRFVWKPIKDIALVYWEEAVKNCIGFRDQNTQASPDTTYLFSKFLSPGLFGISPDQVRRRWAYYVKSPKTGLGINVDLYTLKHMNTTETMDLLSGQFSIEAAEKATAAMNSHTSTAMVSNVYDIKNAERKLDRLKKVNNSFA